MWDLIFNSVYCNHPEVWDPLTIITNCPIQALKRTVEHPVIATCSPDYLILPPQTLQIALLGIIVENILADIVASPSTLNLPRERERERERERVRERERERITFHHSHIPCRLSQTGVTKKAVVLNLLFGHMV